MSNLEVPNKEDLSKLYSLGYSMKNIADILGMSVGKIHKYFGVYGIIPRKHLHFTVRDRISKANKNNTYRKGKKHSEETKVKISTTKSEHAKMHMLERKERNDGLSIQLV